MGSLNTGAIGSQPSVTWVISWSGNSSTFNITCTKNADGYFSGGGWTAYVGFEGGNSGSVNVDAPIGATGSTATTTASVNVTPPGSGTLYFYTTSSNFTSSGVIPYSDRKTASYIQTRAVTVQDRVGSNTGTLLGSGSYTVNYGTSTRASNLRSQTYTGYTYSSDSGSATIYSNTTLYRYFNANSYNIYYYKNDSNGTIGDLPVSGTISYGSKISSATPTNTYVVTLDANGGTCSASSLNSTRAFINWNTASNGTGTSYSPGAEFKQTSALSLYAQWKPATSVTLPVPTRIGYEFVAWGVSATSTSGYTGSYTPSGNITLFAIWKANGIAHVYQGSDGKFHHFLVWVYTGDGGGPSSNGWHHAVPKIYCTSGGSTKFHTCG